MREIPEQEVDEMKCEGAQQLGELGLSQNLLELLFSNFIYFLISGVSHGAQMLFSNTDC